MDVTAITPRPIRESYLACDGSYWPVLFRWEQNEKVDCTKNGDPEAIIRMEEHAGECPSNLKYDFCTNRLASI